MSDTKSASADAGPNLTDGESKFLGIMFKNMTSRPDANWDQVAAELKLKDSKCAKERFRQITKRHGWSGAGGGSAATTPIKPKTTPRKVSEAKVKKEPATPRKGSGKSKAVKDEEANDEEAKGEDVKDEEEDDGLTLPHEMPGMDDEI